MTYASPPWPPCLVSIKFGLESNVDVMTSPLTGASQRTARIGARWKASQQLDVLEIERARPMWSFLTRVQDTGETFLWNNYPQAYAKNFPDGDEDASTCDDAETTCDSTSVTCDAAFDWGLPVVSGSGQTGKALTVRGFLATAALVKGDMIAFDNQGYRELHMLDADATADASGNVTLSFTPPIRISPSDGAEIYIDGQTACAKRRCAGEFMLGGRESAAWQEQDITVGFSFDCFEPLTPLQ